MEQRDMGHNIHEVILQHIKALLLQGVSVSVSVCVYTVDNSMKCIHGDQRKSVNFIYILLYFLFTKSHSLFLYLY